MINEMFGVCSVSINGEHRRPRRRTFLVLGQAVGVQDGPRSAAEESSPLPSRLEPYLSWACSPAWFLSTVLHEWTRSSLYGLNSLTSHMRAGALPSSGKGIARVLLLGHSTHTLPPSTNAMNGRVDSSNDREERETSKAMHRILKHQGCEQGQVQSYCCNRW